MKGSFELQLQVRAEGRRSTAPASQLGQLRPAGVGSRSHESGHFGSSEFAAEFSIFLNNLTTSGPQNFSLFSPLSVYL